MAKKVISVKGTHPVIHELPRTGRRPVSRPGVEELPVDYRRGTRPGLKELPVAYRRPGVEELPVGPRPIWPNELPPYEPVVSTTVDVFVGELESLRARVNAIESDILNLKLGRPIIRPNELPPAEIYE
jgi:hypothetical protein